MNKRIRAHETGLNDGGAEAGGTAVGIGNGYAVITRREVANTGGRTAGTPHVGVAGRTAGGSQANTAGHAAAAPDVEHRGVGIDRIGSGEGVGQYFRAAALIAHGDGVIARREVADGGGDLSGIPNKGISRGAAGHGQADRAVVIARASRRLQGFRDGKGCCLIDDERARLCAVVGIGDGYAVIARQ